MVVRVYDSGWMRRAICVPIVGMALLWPTLGQSKADGRVTVVTVCEVVDNPKLYADSPVAVVGGLESSGYLIDHYEFLFQGGCEHPVTSEGKVWPNKILIWPYSEEGFPKAPIHRPELRLDIVRAKLSMVRKTTKLGFHGHANAPNEWIVVYGRICSTPNLGKKDCGIAPGCRGFDGAPLAIMAAPYHIYRVRKDGTPAPAPGRDGQ